ncbi:MAG: hypothetical protein IJL74_03865 [Bacilli bacterium]|nr:hypothetical protein [Bacilli bacterium]
MTNKKSSKKKKFILFKNIGKFLYRIISSVYSVIDKLVITPVAKLLLLIQKPFTGSGRVLDRLLSNKSVLITLSLIIAIGSALSISQKSDIMMNNYAEVLYNQPVKALYNEEAYVIEGLPKTVDITLIGRRSALYLAKQSAKKEVTIDLRNLKPGSHTVPIKYTGPISNVEYKLNPSTSTVMVYEKMSVSKKVSKEILNEDKMDSKYAISNITFSRDEVYIKGAEYKLDEIAIVKALVDVSKITNPTVGTATLKEIPLVAYDEDGQKLDLEIVPKTLDASIEITSPSKEVPLKVIPEGNVVFGKAINQIALSRTKTTIYGTTKTLEKISYIPVNINVEGLDKNNEYTVNLSLPSGVREMSTKSVIVKVTLADVAEKTIDNVNIATKNLENGLTAQAASQADSVASIIVKGTKANIKDISVDNISAFVDLQGLGKGSHKVPVQVTGDDLKVSYTPKTTYVTIIIK